MMDPDCNAKPPQQSRHPFKFREIPSQKTLLQKAELAERCGRESQHVQRRQMSSMVILYAQKELGGSLRVHGSRAHGGQRKEATLVGAELGSEDTAQTRKHTGSAPEAYSPEEETVTSHTKEYNVAK